MLRHSDHLALLRTVIHRSQLSVDAITSPPFGPGFDVALVQQADRLEVWGTRETAPEDFTEFRLIQNGRVIGVARIPGY